MKLSVLVTVGAAALAGCATAPGQGGMSPLSSTFFANPVKICDGQGTCKIAVSVVLCVPTITPKDALIDEKNVNIFWDLTKDSEAAYRFLDNGASLTNNGVTLKVPDDDFNTPAAQANGKRFKLHDKNSKARPGLTIEHPYTIRLQHLVGSTWYDCGPWDPSLFNQG
jgi:hypothetical protein